MSVKFDKLVNFIKEYKIRIIVIFVVVLGIVLFTYPNRLGNLLDKQKYIDIVITDTWLENASPKSDTKIYLIEKGSKEYEEFKGLLDKYVYHLNINSFFKNSRTSIKLIDKYVSFNFRDENYNSENNFIIYDKNKIKINERSYTLGYFSNDSGIKLIEEIEEITKDLNNLANNTNKE